MAAAMHPAPSAIPAELIERPQWVAWVLEQRNGKPTKVPKNPATGANADTTNPATWGSYRAAVARAARIKGGNTEKGIGYVFCEDDPYTGFDLDKCRDPETGVIADEAAAIIHDPPSYTEVTPSGTGVHKIVRGKLPGDKHKRLMAWGGPIEMYDTARFFTVTGDHLDGTPETIQDAQDALNTLYSNIFPPTPTKPATAPHSPVSMDDHELIERAMKARNGHEFRALWDGNTDAHGGDDSAADLALCNHLMFWTGNDKVQADRLFRTSGLMRPKWERGDYRERTLEAAMQKTTYTGAKPRASSPATITPIRKVDADTGEVLDDPRPGIDAGNLSLPDVSGEAWAALLGANEPAHLFRYAGQVVRMEPDEDGRLVVRALSPERLRHELARAARFYTVKRAGEVDALPPLHVVQDMLASPEPPLPILARITETPIFARGGRLVNTPGYDPTSGILYTPAKGLTVPAIPSTPTGGDMTRARALILDDLMGDFPFISEAERANAVALMILPYVRDLIAGPTPLHLFEAPTPGCGKGLLADVCTQPAVGDYIGTITGANDDDEWRKQISTKLREATPLILLDNITHPLVSGVLASALTASVWGDRVLGTNDKLRVPVRCVWAATANNPVMSKEIARRCVRIRLDPVVERPWQREGFRHADLRAWMAAHRGELVAAALTLVQDWVVKGMRPSPVVLGSFEQWAAVIGGILTNAQIPAFLTNLDEFYEAADLEGQVWRQFVAIWWEKYQSTEVGAGDLFTLATTLDGFDFGKGGDRAQRTSFGMQLTRQRDRVFDSCRIVFAGVSHKAKMWRLIPLHPPEGGTSEKGSPPVSPVVPGKTDGPGNLGEPFTNPHARENTITICVGPEATEVPLGSPPLPGSLATAGKTGGEPFSEVPPPAPAVAAPSPDAPPMPKYDTPKVRAGHARITEYAANVVKHGTAGAVAAPLKQFAADVGFRWIEGEMAQDFAARWFGWNGEQVSPIWGQ